jgi:hypothetical protein
VNDTPNISAATDAVLAALTNGGFDYALIGGLAVILRGHDRYTRDVDALPPGKLPQYFSRMFPLADVSSTRRTKLMWTDGVH